jgi:NADH-quinone oxidoreductase subunit H
MTVVMTTVFLGGYHPLWPAEYGSNFVPSVLLALFGAVTLVHALNPARRRDRFTLPWVTVALFAGVLVFLVPVVQEYLLPVFWFLAKAGAIMFLFIWVRGTLPRFRYDQLMRFAWKFLLPVAIANLMVTALLVALFGR